jgi:hypothetical protein
MSHWNHRVIKTIEQGETLLAIHEVHYDDQGAPIEFTAAVPVEGETIAELGTMLNQMRIALDLPVLTKADFPVDETELVSDVRLVA